MMLGNVDRKISWKLQKSIISHQLLKSNSKCIKELKVRPKTTKPTQHKL